MNNSVSLKKQPKLFCLHYKECDPRKCTALKLNKLNLIELIGKISSPLKDSIILNPFAKRELTILDRTRILKYGVLVIDCSWNNIINLKRLNYRNSRKLPPLIAANPINYGKWEKLSSVEALSAALFITKFYDMANLILSKFSWGNQFKELNKFLKKKD